MLDERAGAFYLGQMIVLLVPVNERFDCLRECILLVVVRKNLLDAKWSSAGGTSACSVLLRLRAPARQSISDVLGNQKSSPCWIVLCLVPIIS